MTAWEVVGTVVWLVAGTLLASYSLGKAKNVRTRRRKWLRPLRQLVVLIIVALGPAILVGAVLYGLIIGPCKGVYKHGVKATAKQQRESQQ